MKSTLLFRLTVLFIASTISHVVLAQQLEIRRLPHGILQVQTEGGLNLIIQPDDQTKVPPGLDPQRSFVLGTEFERTFVPTDGKPQTESLVVNPGEPVPPHIVSIAPTLVGRKMEGIQLQTDDLNVVVVSVESMSDQGWITTQRDENINLLVLTFRDAAKLQTARMNLWISLLKTEQILLNPIDTISAASAEGFYKSIAKPKALPTEVLPVLKLPRRDRAFGDRQVVMLKE